MRMPNTWGDRLLNRFLPKAKAAAWCCPGAGYCSYTHCGSCYGGRFR